MRERIAIFPVDEDSLYLLSNIDKMENYEIVYAVTPTGWDELKDIDSNHSSLICSEETFSDNNYILKIDTLLLNESNNMTDQQGYWHMIELANKNGKRVIEPSDINTSFEKVFEEKWSNTENAKESIVPINIPVIMVVGMGESCEKMELQVQLYDFYTNLGYKAGVITSNKVGKLFNFNTIPSFIYTNEMVFSQQVCKFNSYVNNIVNEDDLDVIIIGVPGSPAIYSKDYPNGFGFIPFLISNAVTPDISILSLYCGEYNENYIREIKSMFFYRFGIKVDYLHISKKVFQYNFESRKIDFFSISDKHRIKEIINLHKILPTCNVADIESTNSVFNCMLAELQSNIEII